MNKNQSIKYCKIVKKKKRIPKEWENVDRVSECCELEHMHALPHLFSFFF